MKIATVLISFPEFICLIWLYGDLWCNAGKSEQSEAPWCNGDILSKVFDSFRKSFLTFNNFIASICFSYGSSRPANETESNRGCEAMWCVQWIWNGVKSKDGKLSPGVSFVVSFLEIHHFPMLMPELCSLISDWWIHGWVPRLSSSEYIVSNLGKSDCL
jgi:hypothetical protein